MKTPDPTPEDLAGHLAIERFGSTAKRARAQIRPGDWSMVKRVGG